MRPARPLLTAACALLAGTVLAAAPAFAQDDPGQPRRPGTRDPEPMWVPGMNLYPATAQPDPPAAPERRPATAGGIAPAPAASPTAAPTAVPTPEPTVAATQAPAPVEDASSGSGLVPLLSVLGLAAVTGPILLVARRRRRRVSPPDSVADDEPAPEPASVWAPEPLPEPDVEWEPMPEPDPDWQSAPILEAAPVATLVEDAEKALPEEIACENCGRQNPSQHLFCDDCGQLLRWSGS